MDTKEEKATRKPIKEETKVWEGKATTKLNGVSAEQVWTILEDFCNFHKWLPTIDTCHHVEGPKGQPGVVRYCASTTTTSSPSESSPPLDEGKKTIIKWCHERLIAIDHVERYMSYEVVDNNMGFKSYVSTIKVLGLEKGCEIEWDFRADPVEGLTCEDLVAYLSFALKGMAENMEKALQ